MKNIVKVSLLIALLTGWAFYGQRIEDWGYKLNALTEYPVWGYFFWATLIALGFYLAIACLYMLHDAISGKKGINVFVIAVFLLLAYFATDIIAKGNTLNSLTPKPLLGYIFWGAILVFVYWQVFWPIISFSQLKHVHKLSPKARAKWALRQMKTDGQNNDDAPEHELYINLSNAEQNNDDDALHKYLAIYDNKQSKKANTIILNYSKLAAITVVVSRNKWWDSAAIIFMQMRMLVELAKLYGGKPSPLFNMLILGWIISSTFINMIVNTCIEENAEEISKKLAETVAENLTEDLDVQFKAVSGSIDAIPFIKMVSTVSSVLLGAVLEASLAGANVYISGKFFLWKLKGDIKKMELRPYLTEKRQGRLIIAKSLLTDCAPQLKQLKESIKKGIKKIAKDDEEPETV